MQFVYGNTVKEMQASSPSRGEEVHRELEEKKRREQEERERRRREEEENQKRKRKRQATARRNQARMLMSPGYLLFVAAPWP
jgi:septal ring factor EnvC (AmiA/AmiB activator)